MILLVTCFHRCPLGAEMYGRIAPGAQPAENFNMMRTIVIAVCCAVAYLAVVIGLTVYCSIRLIRAKNLRKQEDDPCEPRSHSELLLNYSQLSYD